MSGVDNSPKMNEPELKLGEKSKTGVEGPLKVKDRHYYRAAQDARDDAQQGIHRTDEEVEAEAERYRKMDAKESQFQQINRKLLVIMNALAEAPVQKKQGKVEARTATVGEKITTTLEGGEMRSD